MASGRTVVVAVSAALAALTVPVLGQNSEKFTEEQVKQGSDIYAQNCAPCHQGTFDLRKFPREEKASFILSVTKGKNQMPPWGDLFKAEEIEALWAYVMAEEK